MKQTITIMAVIMVLLLAVSGFIVAGSLQQSKLLVAKTDQFNDVSAKLKTAVRAQQELTLAQEEDQQRISALTLQRDETVQKLEDALSAMDETNSALAQRDDQWKQAEADLTAEVSRLGTRLEEQEAANEELTGRVNELTVQRDQAIADRDAAWALRDDAAQEIQTFRAQAETLETEKAQWESQLTAATQQAQQQEKQLADLQAEKEQLQQLNGESEEAAAQLLALGQQAEQLQQQLDEQKKAAEARISALQQQTEQQQAKLDVMQQEAQAFSVLLTLRLAAEAGGQKDVAAYAEAKEAFETAYPQSLFVLPEEKIDDGAEPKKTAAPSATPAVTMP